ncbi:hypothetical protein PAPYR_626 [Paratrimastix pyriformis]|uniref:YbjN domain-containing protein n=1 Tax=Paratrimastix pyriformis TaxID=342808 RepID=A0ABQ8UWY5_9EUKA|nr:hypothetical protein PAPYR_626 [Paratrimastix pyriformis]
MNKTYKADVRRFLDSQDLHYQMRGDTFILPYNEDGDQWVTVINVDNTQDAICVYSKSSNNNIPPERLSAVCEFITRANFGFQIGNWELDIADGECRFKTSVDAEGDDNVPNLLKQLLRRNLSGFRRYLPGIRRVVNGGNPKECCDQCERVDPNGAAVREALETLLRVRAAREGINRMFL